MNTKAFFNRCAGYAVPRFIALLALTLGSTSALAFDESDYTGVCGEHITYEYNPETETLTLSGSGMMNRNYGYEWQNWGEWWGMEFIHPVKHLVIEEGITRIEGFGNLPLTSLSLPFSLRGIGEAAFYSSVISNIVIPEGVNDIGNGAFMYSDFKYLEIPSSVSYIGSNAFTSFDDEAKVKVAWTSKEYIPSYVIKQEMASYMTLLVPRGTKDIYASLPGWQDFRAIEEYVNGPNLYIGGEHVGYDDVDDDGYVTSKKVLQDFVLVKGNSIKYRRDFIKYRRDFNFTRNLRAALNGVSPCFPRISINFIT